MKIAHLSTALSLALVAGAAHAHPGHGSFLGSMVHDLMEHDSAMIAVAALILCTAMGWMLRRVTQRHSANAPK